MIIETDEALFGSADTSSMADSDFAFDFDYSFRDWNNVVVPASKHGFVYSFDKDPRKSGIIAGIAGDWSLEDGKSIHGQVEGVFHLVDRKIKVEDFVARAEYNIPVSTNGCLAPWVEYRYSYDDGPEVNGLFVNIVPVQTWFEITFGNWYSTDLVVSIHAVDNKLSFLLNQADIEGQLAVSGVSEDGKQGYNLELGCFQYRCSPARTMLMIE